MRPSAVVRSPTSRVRRARCTGAATAAHDRSGARRRASAAIAAARAGSVSTDRIAVGERLGVTLGNDDAGAAGEQFDGVRERGRHHRSPGGDGVDEHARGDLVGGVVRQHDQVGRLDQLGQRRQVAVRVVEDHRLARQPIVPPDRRASRDTPRPTAREPSGGWRRRRCRSVAGCRSSSDRHRVDRPLDPLAGPSRPQVSRRGRARRDVDCVERRRRSDRRAVSPRRGESR